MRTGPPAQAPGNSRISAYQPPGKSFHPPPPLHLLSAFGGRDFEEKIGEEVLSPVDNLSAISTLTTQENNPIGSLLLDILLVFTELKVDRLFSQNLVQELNGFSMRPWIECRNGKPMTELWLAQQLRPYGIRPRNVRINGAQAKGYLQEEMMEVFRRYIPKSEIKALLAEAREVAEAPAKF